MLKNNIKPKIIVILMLILLPPLFYATYKIGNKIYRKTNEIHGKEEIAKQYPEFINKCLGQIEKKQHDLVFSALRHCVHINSIHWIDEEFYKTAAIGQHAFAKQVIDYSRGKLKERPHMECSRRALLLKDLYKSMGYDSRNVDIVKKAKEFPDHVVTEVFHPEKLKWEIQDPSYDVYYKSIEHNTRYNIWEIVSASESDIVPCNINDECSWSLMPPDGRLPLKNVIDYWGLAYLNSYDNPRGPLIYNPRKFDIAEELSYKGKQINYCQKRPSQCRKVINILDTAYAN